MKCTTYGGKECTICDEMKCTTYDGVECSRKIKRKRSFSGVECTKEATSPKQV